MLWWLWLAVGAAGECPTLGSFHLGGRLARLAAVQQQGGTAPPPAALGEAGRLPLRQGLECLQPAPPLASMAPPWLAWHALPPLALAALVQRVPTALQPLMYRGGRAVAPTMPLVARALTAVQVAAWLEAEAAAFMAALAVLQQQPTMGVVAAAGPPL